MDRIAITSISEVRESNRCGIVNPSKAFRMLSRIVLDVTYKCSLACPNCNRLCGVFPRNYEIPLATIADFVDVSNLWEADQLCDRIAIIKKGKLIALDSPRELRRLVGDMQVVETETFGMSDEKRSNLEAALKNSFVSVATYGPKQTIAIQTQDPHGVTTQVKQLLEGVKVLNTRVREQSLEDVYLRLVQESKA